MPSERRHRIAAEHNEQLARSLSISAEGDWAAVLAFYSALHYVDAFLATQEFHPRSQNDRHAYISRLAALREIYPDYRTLESRSRDVRYELRRIRPSEADSLIANELGTIKRRVGELIDRPSAGA